MTAFLAWLEASAPADAIRTSGFLFPIIESFHVIGLTMVFGTITIIDLRLLGIGSSKRPFTKVAADVMKWTWAAFALAVVTGSLLFISNADVYFHNFYFRAKMIMLILTGVNMFVFKLTAERWVKEWDKDVAAPPAGRAVAIVSLILWVGIIFCGRWIGFSTQL